MAKSPARKKGASRNTRASSRKGVPGWTWLLLGLAIGVFTAFLWHLWEIRQDPRPAPAMATSAEPAGGSEGKARKDGKPATVGKPAPEETRFEFYTLLPSQEVMPGKGPSASKTPAKSAGQEPAYVLQAGSFKSEAEADKRRASILMLGLPVKVVKVPVKPGETWYRVVVGPFAGKAAAQTARSNLRSNGVDTLVLKQG
jgi:cell division protein FtsN